MHAPLSSHISIKKHALLSSALEPKAKRLHRCMAFILDMSLGTLLILTLLINFILPNNHSKGLVELRKSFYHYQKVAAQGPMDNALQQFQASLASKDIQALLMYTHCSYMLMLWVYFTACDICFKGKSLGKQIFRLKVININTYKEPNFMETSIRSMLKTMSFGITFPLAVFLCPLNLIVFFLSKQNRSGHDLMTQTCVVEDNIRESSKEPLRTIL